MLRHGIKVVSLFDGVSCGRVALGRAGIAVSSYEAFEISPHQLSYVTHANSGEGLLFFGDTIIPFVDRGFDKSGEIYKLLTTRPADGADIG